MRTVTLLTILLSLSFTQDYSLQFDGEDDWVVLDNQIDAGTSYTITAWINPSDETETDFFNIISHNQTDGAQFGCPDDILEIQMWDGSSAEPVVLGGSIQRHTWTHVAYVRNQDTHSIFINGTLSNQNEVSASDDSFDVIAAWLYYEDALDMKEPMHGLLDRISIWSYPLTQENIQSNMLTDFTGDEEGLVAYWDFNEGSGEILNDLSINGNNGTIFSSPIWVENIYGCTDSYSPDYNPEANWDNDSCTYPDNGDYSLSFDGVDDYVDLGNSINLGLNTFTLECMVKTLLPNVSQNLISKRISGPGGKGFAMIIQGSDNDLFPNGGIVANIDDANNEAKLYYFNPINNNEGYHLSSVFDRELGMGYLYLNGNLVYQENISDVQDNINANINLIFGAHSEDQSWSVLNGELDNIKIWNKALNENELNTEVESIEGLIGHYKFNTGSGDIHYDHSGNGNHGTIHGATWVENIYGCTDELAENYNPEANWNDDSCTYPDNGDYSLSFDGWDDYAIIRGV